MSARVVTTDAPVDLATRLQHHGDNKLSVFVQQVRFVSARSLSIISTC